MIDLPYVIYHENHNKFYFFTDTSELKLAPLSTFLFCTELLLCKDRHLHVPKNKVQISEDEGLNSRINIPDIRNVNEGKDRYSSKQSETNRQKPKTLYSRRQDADDDNDNLHISLPSAKLLVNLKKD